MRTLKKRPKFKRQLLLAALLALAVSSASWFSIFLILISTGESETFLQKAIQEQGRGQVLDTIQEIQERHDAVKDIERNLQELHQVFLDMAVLMQAQGEQIDDIENHVMRANSFVLKAKKQQVEPDRELPKLQLKIASDLNKISHSSCLTARPSSLHWFSQ